MCCDISVYAWFYIRMYVCVCVCVCVCLCTYISGMCYLFLIRGSIYKCVCVWYAPTHACIQYKSAAYITHASNMYICIYKFSVSFQYIYIRIRTYIHTYTHIYMHTSTLQMFSVNLLYVYAYKYIYTYIHTCAGGNI
jgi:hypothetical protein